MPDRYKRIKLPMLAVLQAVILLVYQMNAYGYEPEYTAENARSYLLSKDHVFLAMRIDGGMSAGQYLDIMSKYQSEESESDLYAVWKNTVGNYKSSKFIVLKSLKGELDRVINAPNEWSGAYEAPLGESALIFMDAGNEYRLTACNVFPVSLFEEGIIETYSIEKIVNNILTNRLSLCTRAKQQEGH